MALTARSRKKSRKLRGRTRSMGWGRVGQHRKSGSKGGTGGSGMNKHRKTWMLKYYPNWYGAKGFVPIRNRLLHEKNEISLKDLDELAYDLKKIGNLEGDKVVVNLTEMGYDKLIADGKIYEKVKVIVKEATKKATEKVREAGGEVLVEKVSEEEESS
ncbi:MAG: uL15 family ribosomal protein [Caldisphaera sp.]|jgi:large subunit ribosomal protein L15|uniref:uL15 family ribosomal protein n=1 Tax=Caldisphaera sp. TaxID=2060322 RepID=UPI00397D1DFE